MPSKKRSMREALTSSLRSEKTSVAKRFDKAEQIFRSKPTRKPAVEEVPAEPVVRDNFSMPQSDYEMISALRERCIKAGVSVSKSEVVRGGLHALDGLSTQDLLKVLGGLEKLKPGKRARAA